MKIGDKIIDFELKGIDGSNHKLDSYKAKLIAIIFFCNHCPYANAYEERIKQIQDDFKDNLQIIAINSNDSQGYPEDGFEKMITRAKEKGFNFAYLRDKTQEIARDYGGEVTPDVFLFDEKRYLRYRGRVDDNWNDPNNVTKHDFRDAVKALLNNEEVPNAEARAIGCSIKWKF